MCKWLCWLTPRCDRLRQTRTVKGKGGGGGVKNRNSQVHVHSPLAHKEGIGHRGSDDRDALMCANDVVITPTSANGAKD